MTRSIRLADYIMERLVNAGVSHVFTVSGRGALFLTDALAANKSLTTVCMHHEQSAAFAAVANSEIQKEGLGVCLVSTGCAATNTITGVLSAWQDGIPCFFISGQNKISETTHYTKIPLRTYGQQEADIVPIVSSITKYAAMITDPQMIAVEIDKALFYAYEGRKGPVWLDIPLDVQNMRVKPEKLERFSIPNGVEKKPNKDEVEYIISLIKESKRCSILIGSGMKSRRSLSALDKLLEMLPIPVVYSSSAVDLYNDEKPYSIGTVGAMGCTRSGNFTIQNSDLIIVLGSRINSMTTGGDFNKFGREAKIVVVDIDPVEHSKKTVNIHKLIISDTAEFLNAIVESIGDPSQSQYQSDYIDWVGKCLDWKSKFPRCEVGRKNRGPVDLYNFTENLSKVASNRAAIVTDSGCIELILPNNFLFKGEQKAIHPVSQGSMGFALPAIIGAYYPNNQEVIAVVGDGSIMMNLQELETIRYNKIPAKIFVINNNVYGIIRKRQAELFGNRTIGTDPSNGVSCPNFVEIAGAFGLGYCLIGNDEDLENQLAHVLNTEGPVICEVMGLEDQCYIHSSYCRDSNRKFVQRPLEDQSPFLDREVFLKEMIIAPIDQ